MQIQQVVISNVLGLARADIVCTAPVVIVAGNNEAGKSTLSDAISMAILGTPRRVKLKKELGQLLHDSAEKGRVTLMAGGDVMGDFKLPGGAHICELEARHKAFVEFVLDPALFARQDEKDRRTSREAAMRERLKNAHAALDDVRNNKILLMFLLETAMDAGHACDTWEEVHALSETARIPTVMGFGKHKGTSIERGKLDLGYVRWYRGQADTDPFYLEAFKRAGF